MSGSIKHLIHILVTLVIITVPSMEANKCPPDDAHPVCSFRPAEHGFNIIIDCNDKNLNPISDLSIFKVSVQRLPYVSSMGQLTLAVSRSELRRLYVHKCQ